MANRVVGLPCRSHGTPGPRPLLNAVAIARKPPGIDAASIGDDGVESRQTVHASNPSTSASSPGPAADQSSGEWRWWFVPLFASHCSLNHASSWLRLVVWRSFESSTFS